MVLCLWTFIEFKTDVVSALRGLDKYASAILMNYFTVFLISIPIVVINMFICPILRRILLVR